MKQSFMLKVEENHYFTLKAAKGNDTYNHEVYYTTSGATTMEAIKASLESFFEDDVIITITKLNDSIFFSIDIESKKDIVFDVEIFRRELQKQVSMDNLITIDKIKEAISSIYNHNLSLRLVMESKKAYLPVVLFEALTEWVNRDIEAQEKQIFTNKIMELIYLKGSLQHTIDQINIRTTLDREESEWLFNHITNYLYNKQEKLSEVVKDKG